MQRRAKSEAGVDPLSSQAETYSPSRNSSSYSPHKKPKNHSSSTLAILVVSVPLFAVCMLLFAGFYFVPPTPNHMSPNNAVMEPSITTIPASATTAAASVQPKVAGSIGTGSDVQYHIVFSTSCSTFQDWQSYVFFHRALVTKQPGSVTRIVSGCNAEDEVQARKVFSEQIEPMAPDQFKIHFTPDFSTVKPGVKFTYFNKPFGMKHWLENALGYPGSSLHDDSIVVLMDPDQLITRPFANNDFTNERWVHMDRGQVPQTRIEHGKPMGALYGFGLQWRTKVNMTYIHPAGHSPVDDLTHREAQSSYAVSFLLAT